MPVEVAPATLDQLCDVLQDCGASKKTVELGGNFTKRAIAGEITPTDVMLSTRELQRVVAYEPKDLTISVEAGMKFADLRGTLAANGQYLPLDPPFSEEATIGGVVAANCSGPRRRRYGTARDMVIGMKFVTIEGNLVQSGGMVVKNVTGLDMGKLMIGSFGTLACMGVLNFKIFPMPTERLTLGLSTNSLATAMELRRAVVAGVLEPIAIDVLNAEAARWAGVELPEEYSILLEVAGNRATVERCEREFGALAQQHPGTHFAAFSQNRAAALWHSVENLTPAWLNGAAGTHVIRISTVQTKTADIFEAAQADQGSWPVLVRAGNAVGYIYCDGLDNARKCLESAREKDLTAVVEYAPVGKKGELEQWADAGGDLDVMRRVKDELDPDHLLNRGRLFNRI